MGHRRLERAVLAVISALAACAVTHAYPPVPAARPPREKLTLGETEVYEGQRILLDEDSYPREPARVVEGPMIQREGGKVKITFAVDKYDDVLVRVVDAEGKTVRDLACGVLGDNAPDPFQEASLRQEIVWDGKDAAGKPASLGAKIRVAVGLRPQFERFVAFDPTQLLEHICGMEVDKEGRVYVTLFTERRGEPEVRRYSRQGEYLDTVYPPNPNRLDGKLEDVFRYVDRVDGRDVPQRRGGWPFLIYKYHSAYEDDPTKYPFPLRIAPDGQAYIAEIVTGHSDLTPAELAALKPVKCRILPVKLDPFWFLKRMSMGAGAWAVDHKGYAYLCCTNRAALGELKSISGLKEEKLIGNTVLKLSLETLKPAVDFEYNGREELSEKRPYIGTFRKTGEGPEFFQSVNDLTVDRQGNIYVVDKARIKVYRPNGQFIKMLDRFTLDGQQNELGAVQDVRRGSPDPADASTEGLLQPGRPSVGTVSRSGDRDTTGGAGKSTKELGAVHGVRATRQALYVVARLDPLTGNKRQKRWRAAQLVKFQLAPATEPKAVWALPLDGLAGLIAVDEAADPPIVWVAGGGGPATFSRIVDEGNKPGTVQHIGSIRKGILLDPWSLAVDGEGRIFTFDYGRGCIVRTNDDGSDWRESASVPRLIALRIDRKRGRLFQSSFTSLDCSDLDFKKIEDVEFPEGWRNLGAVDADGNLYASRSGATSLEKLTGRIVDRFGPDGLNGLVDRFGPDGALQKAGQIELFQGLSGLAMDSHGCLYVMDTCRGQFQYVAHDVGRRLLDDWPVWRRGGKRILDQSELGYLVKFAPGGGKRGTQTELWAHRGASPVMSQCRCPVNTNCVAVDEADRVFCTDYQRYHVKVLDTAGNLIARIGSWGNAECRGPNSRYPEPEIAFGWLHSIDAVGDTLYASDKDLRRIVKVRLDYRESKETLAP